ncbi:MAG TPA: tRNA dimethylallyltransferase, partial [Methylomirabilota bacterium]|nr:tRNA dimethylallyltransferase [Methylomirabilota bacterium]
EYRRELAGVVATRGRMALHARLAAEAPALARRLHPNDEVRVIRALERVRAGTGWPDDQARWRDPEPALAAVYVGLTLDRAVLARRLADRAEAMIEAGLLDEVHRLLASGYAPGLPALQGIGYRQFVQVALGRLDAAEAARLMRRDTIRYARRQWTWFTREPGIEWLDVGALGSVEATAAAIEVRLSRGGACG